MTISQTEMAQLLKLSQLHIDQAGQTEVNQRLNKVMGMIDTIKFIKTDHILPLSNPHDRTLLLREDKATETNQREAFQAIAPQTKEGFYQVPMVIDVD